MKGTQTELALRYFDYLAECFPVMCASDEFHFLPRAETASRYYDQVDNLDIDAIDECLFTLKQFQNKFNLLTIDENDLEKLIDLELLKGNVAGILIELEKKESWRHNPLLYLKIAFIGLDHALTKPASKRSEQTERACSRLRAIPRLLQQAAHNIDSVPGTYHQAALAMIKDCKSYLGEIKEDSANASCRLLIEGLQKAWSALDSFGKFLSSIFPVLDRQFVAPALETTLREHFISVRTLHEVFQIAEEEWRENLEQLERLQRKIDSTRSWQDLYHSYSPFIV